MNSDHHRARALARALDDLIRLRLAKDLPAALAHLERTVGSVDKPALRLLRDQLLTQQQTPPTAAAVAQTVSRSATEAQSIRDILRIVRQERINKFKLSSS